MATESVIFTALPNGIDRSGLLKVTVFVSPRLSTDGAGSLFLSSFPAFENWPKTFARLREEGGLVIEFEGSGPVSTDPDPESEPPDPDTWALLFDPDKVGVRTGEFKDVSDRRVLTFPTADVADHILNLYLDVAANSPTSFPPATKGRLAFLGRELGLVGFNPKEFYGELDSRFTGESKKAPRGRFFDRSGLSPAQAQRFAFVQAQRFYDRPNTRDPLGPTTVPDPPKPPEIDFHGYCASVGDYPRLLRPLALAVDLLVKAPAGMGSHGRIRVHVPTAPPDLSFAHKEAARPWTNFQQRDNRFIPLPRDDEDDLVDGALRLEDKGKRFAVHQIDVDGSVLKTIDFAANVRRIAAHLGSTERSMSEDAASLPALRTGGFVVTRDDPHASWSATSTTVWPTRPTTPPTRPPTSSPRTHHGYRPDVKDDSGRWHTLVAREGSYVVERPGGPVWTSMFRYSIAHSSQPGRLAIAAPCSNACLIRCCSWLSERFGSFQCCCSAPQPARMMGSGNAPTPIATATKVSSAEPTARKKPELCNSRTWSGRRSASEVTGGNSNLALIAARPCRTGTTCCFFARRNRTAWASSANSASSKCKAASSRFVDTLAAHWIR